MPALERDDKGVQVDLQDLGYETTGKSENDREESSSTGQTRLRRRTLHVCLPEWTLNSRDLGLESLTGCMRSEQGGGRNTLSMFESPNLTNVSLLLLSVVELPQPFTAMQCFAWMEPLHVFSAPNHLHFLLYLI